MRHYTWDGEQHKLSWRDTQKSRVYRAERMAFRGIFTTRQLGRDIEFIQVLADGITESDFWRKLLARSGRVPCRVKVKQGRAGTSARGSFFEITLPDWAKTVPVFLHELAHSAASGSSHHWPFCAAFLALVKEYMGQDWHDRLHDAFRREKVRFRPKRKATEAQRRAGHLLAARSRNG